MGVRRAVELACTTAGQSAGKVYTLGPLIHNSQALDTLRRRGLDVLDEQCLPGDLGGVSVIIRAHGVSPQTEAELQRRGAAVVDATCPRVKASQLTARSLASAGYSLFLAGEESHAEITGICGYAGAGTGTAAGTAPRCVVVGGAEEAVRAAAALYAENPSARTALIGQTTISAEEYRAIGDAIIRFFPDLAVEQTICAATRERQDSLRGLLNAADAFVIAGGKESANTRRLFAIAQASGKPCALAETAADIPPEFFRFESVGLAAGASTPDSVVDAIEQALSAG